MDFTIVEGVLKRYTGDVPDDVIIPEGVVEIGTQALNNCGTCHSITFPKSLRKVNPGAFGWKSTFKTVYISSLEQWMSIDFAISPFQEAPGDLFVDGVKLENVIIPDGTLEIPSFCFYNCASLKTVTLPEGIQQIGKSAFQNCENLTSINLPDSIFKIGQNAFDKCGLERIVIPKSLTEIEAETFQRTRIKELVIPEKIERIGNKAFYECNKLNCIMLPPSVKRIGFFAFAGDDCPRKEMRISNLKQWLELSFPGEIIIQNYDLILDDRKLTPAELLSGMDSIPKWAFFGCNNFVHLTIPPEITRIGEAAFHSCNSLESVDISGNTSIDKNAFMRCPNLKEVKLSNEITKIGEQAFCNCISLTKINIPEGITIIPKSMFHSCKSLETISLPQNIKEIDNEAFCCCESLKKVNFPEGLTRIGKSAFCKCASLERICLPDSITSIGDKAFSDCVKLELVNLPKHLTYLAQEAFSYSEIEEICVPEDVKRIIAGAFKDCKDLKKITIPDNVNFDNNYAISCPALTTLVFKGEHYRGHPAPSETCPNCKKVIISKEGMMSELLDRRGTAFWQDFPLQVEFYSPDGKRLITPKMQMKEIRSKRSAKLSGADKKRLMDSDKWAEQKQLYLSDLLDPQDVETIDKIQLVLYLYANQMKKNPVYRAKTYKTDVMDVHISNEADEIASTVDKKALMDAIELKKPQFPVNDIDCGMIYIPLAEDYNFKEIESFSLYPMNGINLEFLLPLCRYADSETVKALIHNADYLMKNFSTEGRRTAIAIRSGLMLNDTKEAINYLEKCGQLKLYAEIRGKTEQEIRSSIITDTGLNADGIMTFDF